MKDVDELTGAELRDAVAVEVMGWKNVGLYHTGLAGHPPGDDTAREPVPDWPGDISPAMDVLCKARGEGEDFVICNDPESDGYLCTLDWGGNTEVQGKGNWISEAICRAALKKVRAAR